MGGVGNIGPKAMILASLLKNHFVFHLFNSILTPSRCMLCNSLEFVVFSQTNIDRGPTDIQESHIGPDPGVISGQGVILVWSKGNQNPTNKRRDQNNLFYGDVNLLDETMQFHICDAGFN